MDMQAVGKNLRRLRKNAGMNAAELAAKSGVAAISIYLIETGHWCDMNCSTLLGLCRGLGCSAHDIVGKPRKKKTQCVKNEAGEK